MKEFALYLDESGSQKPSPHDKATFFAMGGVIIERGQEKKIESLLNEFKTRWGIGLDVPLHSTDMRSKKKNFRFLEEYSQEELGNFYNEIHNMISTCSVTIHACVVSRQGYLNRFQEIYGQNTWEMMKSSFSILVERSAKYVQKQGGKIMVYFEEAGKIEDTKVKSYFKDIRSDGLPFNQSTSQKYNPCTGNILSELLSGIEGKKKTNPVMQIADYCLHPIADVKLHSSNRAHKAFSDSNLIVDCTLTPEEIKEFGIKYYCY
jgi:Protein of unknown function (DUF3800)